MMDQREEDLKTLVRDTETRYIDYKKALENVGRNRDVFPPADPFVQWYRGVLRDMKNQEEGDLARHRQELTDYRQGLNPPFMYRKLNN